jgi:hypothetical protein
MYVFIGAIGSAADIVCYRYTDAYLQQNGITWDDDETGLGDSKMVGKCNTRVQASNFLRPYTAAQLNSPPLRLRPLREAFNDALGRVETVVEQAIGGIKRSAFAGDRSKSRVSLHSNPEHAKLFFESCARLQMCKMRWRGQFYRSNPAVLSHGIEGVNEARKIINEYLTSELFTVQGRKKAFFGEALYGLNQEEPDVLNSHLFY